jgi:hypothetical protein
MARIDHWLWALFDFRLKKVAHRSPRQALRSERRRRGRRLRFEALQDRCMLNGDMSLHYPDAVTEQVEEQVWEPERDGTPEWIPVEYDDNGNYLDGGYWYTPVLPAGYVTELVEETILGPFFDSPPTPQNDSYSGIHDQPLTIDASSGVLANDSDPENDDLTASVVSGPANGTLSLNSDGSFEYTPNPGFVGADAFVYQADDGYAGGTANSTVTIQVTNQAPVASADSYSTSHTQALVVAAASGLMLNDSDPDGDSLTAQLAAGQGPAHGTVNVSSDGSFVYTPDPGYSGSDSFAYIASDSAGATSTATVSLDVTNTPPAASDLSFNVSHGQTLTVDASAGILSAASDADNDPLTASVAVGPANGTVLMNNDGSFTYTPNPGFIGTDSFDVAVSDLAATATATVTIQVTNSLPQAGNGSFQVSHDQGLFVPAISGALSLSSDPDNDPLTATLVSGTAYGTLALNSNGSFTYQPAPGYIGPDSFDYEVSDGMGFSNVATVTIAVTNQAPSASDLTFTAMHGQALAITANAGLLAGLSDPDGDPLTALLDNSQAPAHGAVTVHADGSFEYYPSDGFAGTDSFGFIVSDGFGGTATATATITLTNNAPTLASDPSFSVAHRQTLTVLAAQGLLAGASDLDGDHLTARLADGQGPANGSVTISADGSFVYTPASDFAGTDTFQYTIDDGFGGTFTATATIDVTDQAPQLNNVNVTYLMGHNQTLVIGAAQGLLLGASDPDGDALSVMAMVGQGTNNGAVSINTDGSFSYTPNSGFIGSDSFTYQIVDGYGGVTTATATIIVGNTPPTAQNLFYSVAHDHLLEVDAANGLLTGGSDPDSDPLTSSKPDGEGTYQSGSVSMNSDGSFDYRPPANFVGTDLFIYQVSDGLGGYATATVTVDVTNAAPVVTNLTFTVGHNQSLVVSSDQGLLSTASDADGDTLSAVVTNGPSNGTLSTGNDGAFVFSPYWNYLGSDSFGFQVSDAHGGTANATVTIQVTNAPPTASDLTYEAVQDQMLTINASSGLLSSASDPDGDALTLQLVDGQGPANGTVSINSDGSFTYTPNTGFAGTDSFTYQVSDGLGGVASATATINVAAVG